ncbi:hypothetical protein ONS96_002608 [Cadophora gregata f. sp. sojae]|nr:hypothetical protein ONS96_002608 [Cadophora gregata f. sp. sojae]
MVSLRNIPSANTKAIQNAITIFRSKRKAATVISSQSTDSTCTFPIYTNPSLHSVIEDDDTFTEFNIFRYNPGYEDCMVKLVLGREEGEEADDTDEEKGDGKNLETMEKGGGKAAGQGRYQNGYYEDDGEENGTIPKGPMLCRYTNSEPPVKVLNQ